MSNTLSEVSMSIPPSKSEIDRKTNGIYFCAGICILLVACVVLIPFIILDLHVAYSSDSCVDQSHFITLKTYLQVSGYFAIGSLVYFSGFTVYVLKVAAQIDTGLTPVDNNIVKDVLDNKFTLLLLLTFANKLIAVFGLAWAILGGVLYWRDVTGCNSFTNGYMYARLIISYIFYGYDLLKKDKK